MERRILLKFLLATPAAALIDYEKLLWIPEKTIFIPSQAQLDFINDTRPRIIEFGTPVSVHHAWLKAYYGGLAGGGKTNILYDEIAEVNQNLFK